MLLSLFLFVFGLHCSSAGTLVITIMPGGTDSIKCMRGEDSCHSIDYVLGHLGESEEQISQDVTVVVTYNQKIASGHAVDGITNLTIIGQGDVTFSCVNYPGAYEFSLGGNFRKKSSPDPEQPCHNLSESKNVLT